MTNWKCPKCELVVKAIATQVTHRCPSNKNEPTNLEEQA
jgi:hypothetical protein